MKNHISQQDAGRVVNHYQSSKQVQGKVQAVGKALKFLEYLFIIPLHKVCIIGAIK